LRLDKPDKSEISFDRISFFSGEWIKNGQLHFWGVTGKAGFDYTGHWKWAGERGVPDGKGNRERRTTLALWLNMLRRLEWRLWKDMCTYINWKNYQHLYLYTHLYICTTNSSINFL
jgi:hypothetical protein